MPNKKLLLTSYHSYEAAFLCDDTTLYDVKLNNPMPYHIGDVFVGKVAHVVPNIDACFVTFMDGQNGFLPLKGIKVKARLTGGDRKEIKAGDELVIQIEKEAVKTKEPVLTTDISFSSDSLVLMPFSHGIHYSKKFTPQQKDLLWQKLSCIVGEVFGEIDVFLQSYGMIVRTNALTLSDETLSKDLHDLFHKATDVVSICDKRCIYSKLYEEDSFYIQIAKNLYYQDQVEIITDDQAIYQLLSDSEVLKNEKYQLRLYEDKQLSLCSLYAIENQMKDALARKVWLKSGGFLIIEPTEAMVVIDVNSGKAIKGKEKEESYYKINIEAAREIAKQLRIRNLSGIIMIDFINMESEAHNQQLMTNLQQLVKGDSVETVVVERTKLGLFELTRKKTRAPLYEILKPDWNEI